VSTDKLDIQIINPEELKHDELLLDDIEVLE
jgi:hypothetical protein